MTDDYLKDVITKKLVFWYTSFNRVYSHTNQLQVWTSYIDVLVPGELLNSGLNALEHKRSITDSYYFSIFINVRYWMDEWFYRPHL